jgi:hypothetical protein
VLGLHPEWALLLHAGRVEGMEVGCHIGRHAVKELEFYIISIPTIQITIKRVITPTLTTFIGKSCPGTNNEE